MGRPRRKLVWATTASIVTLNEAVPILTYNTDLLGALEVNGTSKVGCTVMRTHLQLELMSPGLTAADEVILAAVGVMGQEEIGLGLVTAHVSSANNATLPWAYWWQRTIEASNGIGDTLPARWQVDIKSRRRVSQIGQTYALSLCYNSTVGGHSAQLNVTARTLVALP